MLLYAISLISLALAQVQQNNPPPTTGRHVYMDLFPYEYGIMATSIYINEKIFDVSMCFYNDQIILADVNCTSCDTPHKVNITAAMIANQVPI